MSRRVRHYLFYVLFAALLASPTAAREPFKILLLSPSWGATAAGVGMRDGLVALGYRENRDFFIGVRFTRGNIAALSEGARDGQHSQQSPGAESFQKQG